jgi:PST family polysaccharide transporter
MLARKTALAGALTVGARLATRLLDLITMIVLARILLPTDFGLVAIAVSLVAVTDTVLELPLNQALLRLPTITGPHYDTAFTLSVLRGVALGVVLCAAAWPFAHFFADARLSWLVLFLALSPIARSLVSPCLAEYQQAMSFWRDFAIEVVGKLVAFTFAILAALLTGSYWSIAIGTVVYSVAMTVASYVFAPYRPRFSLSELAIFAGFLGWTSAAQVISAVNWQYERLLLGKLNTTAQLGLFTAASDIAGIPFLALFGPMQRPMLAAFSTVRHDEGRLAQHYQTASAAVFAIGLPLLVGESLVAEPTIKLILGDQWLHAVPILQLLALGTVPALLAMPAIPLLMLFAETKRIFQRNLLELSVKFPLSLVAAIEYGFIGVAAARFVSEMVAGCFCFMAVRRLLKLSIRQQCLNSWRSVVSCLFMVPAVLLCKSCFATNGGTATAAANVIVSGSVGAIVYAAAMCGLWTLSRCPPGIEAMAVSAVSNLLQARRRRPA